MAFENLSERLQKALQKIKGRGKIDETTLNETMREVRLALLEADVSLKVVKEFIAKLKERALGAEVMKSLTPGQMVIKVVNEELTELMGGQVAELSRGKRPPTVIMMVGLQGAGKTTTTGKLAKLLQKQKKKSLLAACDIYRPAAIKQLQVLGESLGVPVFTIEGASPVEIAKKALEEARKGLYDYLIIDTAGRLHVDEDMMKELQSIQAETEPDEILMVVDAMTGQEGINVASAFNEQIDLTGFVLTKLDGDARGGISLSIKASLGKPIKFVGTGEKTDALEPFHPDRMSSRILGMGDVLTLIEKAQENIDLEKAKEMESQMKKGEFTLSMFLDSMNQMKKMGPLEDLLKMIPGIGKQLQGVNIDKKQMSRLEAIVQSMTKKERENPDIINSSRKKRIAAGSGTTVADVNRFLAQFEQMKKMMKGFSGMQSRMMKKGKKKKRK